MPDSSFEGRWRFSGADVNFDPAHFEPRFTYRGNLDLHLSGDTLYFSGKVETRNAKNDEFLGTAELSGEGPVSNNQVAAYYDYTNERVQGFGTAFMQFDYAGQEASAYLVFRVTTGFGSDSLPSDGLHHFHEGDTYNPVEPAAFLTRLQTAGFDEITLHVGHNLIFTARKQNVS